MRKLAAVLLVLVSMLSNAGCGTDNRDLPEVYAASVTIELNGQPVEAASVVLEPVDKSGGATASRGLTDAKGTCVLTSFSPPIKGVVPGEYLVMVRKIETITAPDPSDEDPNGVKIIEERHIVPQKYERFDKNGLTLTVTPQGPNDFRFQLEN